MFDGLIAFGHSIWSFCDPLSIGLILLSSLVGVIIGALPGLTATMGVALMTTLTIKMPSNQALLVLICTYVGAIYGGSRSAILLNIPGTPASAASCLDGHALAKQGLAGRAMGIATSGSVLGTLIGMVFLALFTPILGNLALKFGAYEFFWLALFGVIIAGTLTGDDPLKGWIAGLIGIFTAAIGQEAIYAYDRFSFGNRDLAGGLQLVPALVGAFGFAELLMAVREKPVPVKINPFDSVIPKLKDVTQYWRTILRSGVIGTFIGILPGVGEDVAAWSSYAAAKRVSKEKEKFGKGSIDGLMAAETGDNACVPGAVIPVLTLAVPGSAPAAVLMAAMLIHGVRPGPMIMVEAPTFVYDVVAMMMFATIGILIYGLTLTKLLIKVLMVPKPIILPIIFVLCVVGSYAISQRLFDVWVMLGFGVLGYALRRLHYPVAPLVLGMVLGRPDGKRLPARTRAVRRQPRAVLHAPDFRRALDHDRRGHPAQVSGRGSPAGSPHAARGTSRELTHAFTLPFFALKPCRSRANVETLRLGVIMNGVTGRMGTNQHLIRSINAIRKQGGVALPGDRRIMPDPILVGRNAAKVAALARAHGVERWTTDLDAALADKNDAIYFDSASTGLRPELIRKAIAAGKHIYTEKPVAPTVADALDLYRRAEAAGVKHGVVQDKLWLPGLLKLKMLIDSGFFGRILSVRGEFGYWVFEGDWQPAQRPSWNYRKEDDGGIIVDMLCHWRYVLDNLFGAVKSVMCIGATHIPKRWDENGKPYAATAEDAAYATFELDGGGHHRADQQLVVHARAARRPRHVPCGRHARLRRRGPHRLPDPAAHGDTQAGVESRRAADDRLLRHVAARPGEPRIRQRVQGRVGALPPPRRRRRSVPVEPAGGSQGRSARRARPAELARAALGRCPGAVGLALRALVRTVGGVGCSQNCDLARRSMPMGHSNEPGGNQRRFRAGKRRRGCSQFCYRGRKQACHPFSRRPLEREQRS